MPKNILKLCLTALLFAISFVASAQHYDLPSEAEVLDYWRDEIRTGWIENHPYPVPRNETAMRLFYDKAAKSDPDALYKLGHFYINAHDANTYKGLYLIKKAAEQGGGRRFRFSIVI